MSKRYETVYIFASALEEPQITERLAKYHAILGGPEAIQDVTHWGKRTLAYPVKKQPVGYYVVAKYESTPDRLAEYQRLLKLDEGLLRFLVVLSDAEAGVVTASTVRDREPDELEEDEP